MTMFRDPLMEEEEERRKRAMQSKIAQTQVQQTPLAQRQGLNPMPAGGAGMKSQLLKSALGSMLGPAGGILGGLFNEGGRVSDNKGNSWWNWFYGSKAGKKGSLRDQTNWGKNMGGPISANPYGYNEGGSVMETPIKKVMDEQKLEQQAKAFELEQKRKQEAHEQAMRIKEQQAKQAAAMKKASATTNKKPKAPLAK